MIRFFLILLVSVMVLGGPSQAKDAADLVADFRIRTNEPDTSESFSSDTAIARFLNMGQDKVVRLAQFLRKSVDVVYNSDSITYALPTDFKTTRGILTWMEGIWGPFVFNPMFGLDTVGVNGFVEWEHPNQATLYLQGGDAYDGDTIRVFYNGDAPDMDVYRSLFFDDTSGVTYTSIDTSGCDGACDSVWYPDSCYVPDDLHVFIIEEAISYQEQAKRAFQQAQLIRQEVRLDLGIVKPTVDR